MLLTQVRVVHHWFFNLHSCQKNATSLRSSAASAKGGVAVLKPVKILALPKRGGSWPLPKFFWWICHSVQGLTWSDNRPLKVLTFPQKMTIHPQLVNISPQQKIFTSKYVPLRALSSIVASRIYALLPSNPPECQDWGVGGSSQSWQCQTPGRTVQKAMYFMCMHSELSFHLSLPIRSTAGLQNLNTILSQCKFSRWTAVAASLKQLPTAVVLGAPGKYGRTKWKKYFISIMFKILVVGFWISLHSCSCSWQN